jgi:hypothetical protein
MTDCYYFVKPTLLLLSVQYGHLEVVPDDRDGRISVTFPVVLEHLNY